MNLKVGDVVRKPDGLFIVTDISEKGEIEFEDFKDFIDNNYAIEFEGKHRTLHQINQFIAEKYLSDGNRTIIDLVTQ